MSSARSAEVFSAQGGGTADPGSHCWHFWVLKGGSSGEYLNTKSLGKDADVRMCLCAFFVAGPLSWHDLRCNTTSLYSLKY